MTRHPNVINVDELEFGATPRPGPPPFGGKVKRLAASSGAKQLGCNWFAVAAGETLAPLHAHHNNEEAIFVLRGEGTAQIGEARIRVRSGDWISLPAGEAHAHQLCADQGVDLEYLAISTMNEVDLISYPASQKLLATVRATPPLALRKMFHAADGDVDYWDGEGNRSE
jgi:uncharacterized cupin superfamily protein